MEISTEDDAVMRIGKIEVNADLDIGITKLRWSDVI